MITKDAKGNKKFSMNPQVGRALIPPSAAKPAIPALPGMEGDADNSNMTPPAAEPLNVTCPTCGAQVPVTADNISQPDVDDNSNGEESLDEGDMS